MLYCSPSFPPNTCRLITRYRVHANTHAHMCKHTHICTITNSTVTTLCDGWSGVIFSAEAREVFFPKIYSPVLEPDNMHCGLLNRGKAAEVWGWQLTSDYCKDKYEWSYACIPSIGLYAFYVDGLNLYTRIYTGCRRRNVPDFGRVFLMLKYTDITQNTYVQSWTVTEIMAREVWNFDSCYTLTDYQIHIKTGRNMWFL